MNYSSVQFGFIGAGAIAQSSAESVNKHLRAKVVAVQDPHEGRRRELCAQFEIPGSYATAEELFADPEVHAVYIAVPNKFHIPLTLQAIEAGKHVILEKPFAIDAAEAQMAADAAREAGRVLTLGMNQRFNRNSQKFRTMVADGIFGDIYHAKARWLRRTGIPKLGTWFGSKDLAGGGCLYDIGVHVLDLCLYVIGNFEPVSAYGSVYSKFGPRGLGEGSWGKSDNSCIPFEVEDFAAGQIRFANGATVGLDVTWARHAEQDDSVDIEIFGTEAGGAVYSNKVFRRDHALGASYTIENPQAAMAFPHQDRFHNFINHLLGEEELCVTLEQALVVQRILDALAESSRTGQSVSL